MSGALTTGSRMPANNRAGRLIPFTTDAKPLISLVVRAIATDHDDIMIMNNPINTVRTRSPSQ
jgi:hypothetical protein